jgi:hypothetical protein
MLALASARATTALQRLMDIDALTTILIIVVELVLALVACSGLSRRERAYAISAFALHVLFSGAQWWLHEFYYNGGDAFGYQYFGQVLAPFLQRDFFRFAPELLKTALHVEGAMPIEVMAEGSSTGTMCAIAAFFVYAGGSSLLSMCLVTTWISWFGQLCWYRLAREELTAVDHVPAMLGLMFVPSAVFWGAAFEKESLVLGALGVLGFSAYRTFYGRNALYLIGVVVGGIGVAMLKSYTLFPLVLGASTFVYARRVTQHGGVIRLRLGQLIVAGGLALGGAAAIGSAFPEYSADQISETVSVQQQAWAGDQGGSAIDQIGGHSASITDQLEMVPLALTDSLFRPAVFEAKNGAAMGAALETTLLAIALLLLVDGRGVVLRALFGTPLLLAAVAFVLVFAVAVGLTTSNLGSLSRYRVPMMPFWAMVLLVLNQRRRLALRVERERRVAPARRRAAQPVASAAPPH